MIITIFLKLLQRIFQIPNQFFSVLLILVNIVIYLYRKNYFSMPDTYNLYDKMSKYWHKWRTLVHKRYVTGYGCSQWLYEIVEKPTSLWAIDVNIVLTNQVEKLLRQFTRLIKPVISMGHTRFRKTVYRDS